MTPADSREVPCDVAGGCGARVRWYYSTGGKILTLDTDSHEDGNVIIVSHDGRIRARILTGTELPATQPAYRRHRCPPKPERPGPVCAGCHGPMDRTLAALERWSYHPCCEPGAAPAAPALRRR